MNVWRSLIGVACGGAMGAALRFAVGLAAVRWLGSGFPYGTLAVNLAGCFLLGMLGEYALLRQNFSKDWYNALASGFLGGLTTFSAFGYETFRHSHAGAHGVAFTNVALNLFVGFAAVWFGVQLTRWFVVT